VAAALFAYPFSPGYQGTSLELGDIFGMIVGTVLLLGCVALSIAGGVGLLKSKEWARVAGIATGVTSLLLVPLGTVAGALSLVYLLRGGTAAHSATIV
jgi:hypothetical protein